MIPESKHFFLYYVLYNYVCLAICAIFICSFICCLDESYSEHFYPGVAIVDFLNNIIQTYQYISCVYCISVQLYSFENHILVITQQFLVLHKGVQQQTNAAYQKSMLVVTATS